MPGVLNYLEELCAAMLAHDASVIDRLLRDPLARTLPRAVREEALAFAALPLDSCRAPMHALQFLNQTQKLVAIANRGSTTSAVGDPDQLLLPWAANDR
jgi:hypothetical protein